LESFQSAGEFLDYVSLATSVDDSDASADSVNIMTVHASKGLEFPFVFLPGWNQGTFPSDRTIEELGNAGIEEERRLAYVAITRAMEQLYISNTKLSFVKQGFSLSTEKSMFLDEILHKNARFEH
jgi:DNA helicase-2/ATP-dependent DNA helicase PcrA